MARRIVRHKVIRLLAAETEKPFATDAGELCLQCGSAVSWVDHLPPLKAGRPVRCFSQRKAG